MAEGIRITKARRAARAARENMYTTTLLIGILATFTVGKFLIPELRKLKAGQSIRTDGPTWHAAKEGTPTMGGIMFILGIGIAILIGGWKPMLQGDFNHLYLYLFALIYGLIGFMDDYRKVKRHQNEGLTARQKFILQLFAAVAFLVLMRYEGLLTNKLYVPFFNASFTINWIVYLIFAAFVIVGTVNAVNITDGVDGLAAGVTWVVALFFFAAAVLWKYTTLGVFSVALIGGLMAFLIFNIHPAKVFMGDTGSLFLGGAVAALAFALDMPLILIPVGIIYILETLSDIIQISYFKATHGKRIFKMAPLHHHLELSGWSEKKIVSVFMLVTVAGCGLALWGIYYRF